MRLVSFFLVVPIAAIALTAVAQPSPKTAPPKTAPPKTAAPPAAPPATGAPANPPPKPAWPPSKQPPKPAPPPVKPAPPVPEAPKSPPPEAPKSAPPPAPVPSPDPAPAPASMDEEKEVTQETKDKAKEHFQRGIKLLRDEAWAPALAEFLASRELYPTRVATNNAAIALRKLQRYDESLDMYETLLRDFELPPPEKDSALAQVAELRALVGTVDIRGDVPPGARIAVSSVDRGEYPPVKPIRVGAGSHVVRIFKEGYQPFETRVEVAGGQTANVEAKLAKLTASGKLRVTERSGRTLDVLVDNVVVGKTPWIGTLGVGTHVVRLVGAGKLGSQPAAAEVKPEDTTNLAVVAEELGSQLRVDPTPPGASVWLDGVNVGNGVWLGRVRTGAHKLEIKADGFLTAEKAITLREGERETMAVELDRDEDAPQWRKPPKWTIDAGAAFVVAPTFGGDVATSCEGDCQSNIGIGGLALVHGSYELGSGLGFGIELGYLVAQQQVQDRTAALQPHGLATPNAGTATDDLRLQGFLAGARAGYHLGEDIPVVLGLGAGVLVGELRDERKGVFTDRAGSSYDAAPATTFPGVTYFYLDPGIRVGVRFADHFELTASVQALLLIALSQPEWDETVELDAGGDGAGSYSNETLMGSFVAMVAPGVNLRYDY
jgi:PEGA domain-containing protein